MSQHTASPRPWYCLDQLTDEYLDVGRTGEDLMMIKTIKAIQSLIANIGVIIVAVVSIRYASADATYVGMAAIVTLGLLNGVMAVDYASLARAVVELSQETTDSDDN